MKAVRLAAMLAATTLILTGALAQPDPGSGGPGMAGPGMGGPGMGWKGWTWNGTTVPGWHMMTSEERAEHRDKMRSMKTYDECKAYHEEHRKLMEQRAKDKGATLPTPRANSCDMMRARGILQ